MVPQQAQSASAQSLHRPDDCLYCVFVEGNATHLYWSEMRLAQRLSQIAIECDAARQRAAFAVRFGIYA
jgi:hypothetical protein